MREPVYTVWFQDGGGNLEFLSEQQMREQAKRYRFDAEEVINYGETFMWNEGVEPYDNPSSQSDDICGGCYKLIFQFVVHSYTEPSRCRYKSEHWRGYKEKFQSQELAFKKAFSLIWGGAFDVSVRLDLESKHDTICDFEPLPCPYEELRIDPRLQELQHHKEEIETALSMPDVIGTDKVEEYSLTLSKINSEIEELEIDQFISRAVWGYESEDVQVDHDAEVEKAEGGAWVQAWVWVADQDEDRGAA